MKRIADLTDDELREIDAQITRGYCSALSDLARQVIQEQEDRKLGALLKEKVYEHGELRQ